MSGAVRHAGLELLVQDFVSETDGGVLHGIEPSVSYFEANNMAHDILQSNPRHLLEQRVRCPATPGSADL